jgi:RNA recognition motif-containing protein
MNIYVGNLAPDVTEEDMRQLFEGFGEITSVTIIKDKFSGESRGFGFVDMPAKTDAQAAINGLNDKELKGRALNVSEARPRPEGQRGGAGGGRRGPGGFGGGGGRRGGSGGAGGGGGRYSR